MTKKVFIAGYNTPSQYGIGLSTANLFKDAGWGNVQSIKEADLVVFTGGEDISPRLYGENPSGVHHWNSERDKNEINVYNEARSLSKPVFGICRGLQFLVVMQGGSLWQHITDHSGPHKIHFDKRYLGDNMKPQFVNSLHHQMVIPTKEMDTLAWATPRSNSTRRNESGTFSIADLADTGYFSEPEIVYNAYGQMLGVQFHPEFMKIGDDAVKTTFELIEWII